MDKLEKIVGIIGIVTIAGLMVFGALTNDMTVHYNVDENEVIHFVNY